MAPPDVREKRADRAWRQRPPKRHPAQRGDARQNLFEFLSGWLGGPPLYAQKHGHPRLCTRLALADALQTGRPHGQLTPATA
ncbi:globin domain-containing protein [Tepidimonas fonticaldi]|uniref:globin domain-containing protein n=1 Tax=Tepidimonas fonticaldi TaxID=1101373 RepID=UPI001E32BC9B|nr:hypothetical protein [Tepidimonas fonticaldi]